MYRLAFFLLWHFTLLATSVVIPVYSLPSEHLRIYRYHIRVSCPVYRGYGPSTSPSASLGINFRVHGNWLCPHRASYLNILKYRDMVRVDITTPGEPRTIDLIGYFDLFVRSFQTVKYLTFCI